jgi:hypothetical protein
MWEHTLRIAVAGRRSHPNLQQLQTDRRLPSIFNALSAVQNEYPGIRIQFMTGLADGADQLVAAEMLAHPFDTRPRLDAIIPFSVDCYKHHPLYPITNEFRFESVLKQCVSVTCVNDEATSARVCAASYAHLAEAADRGYDAQAMLMLGRCDVLLAIADPADPFKIGGTLHTVSRALASSIPVLFVSLAAGEIRILNNYPGQGDLLRSLLRIQPSSTGQEDLMALFRSVVDTQRPAGGTPDIPFEKLLMGDPEGSKTASGSLVSLRRKIWSSINTSLKRRAAAQIQAQNQSAPPSDEKSNMVAPMLTHADTLNGFYADQYRGGFILNNGLAVVAVTIAISSLYLLLQHHINLTAGIVTLACLAVLKLIVILVIYQNSRLGHHRNWNEKAVQTRYLAERLRVFEYLFLNGIFRGAIPSLGRHVISSFNGSPPEAAYRKAEGYVSFPEPGFHNLDPRKNFLRMKDELVAEQVAFHNLGSRKMKILEHFLERWGKTLNIVTILLVAFDIVVLFAALYSHICHSHNALVEAAHHYVAPVFICLTALLPALVAGFNAVRFQTEAKKLKERYTLMKEMLSAKFLEMDVLLKADPSRSKGSEIIEFFPIITDVEQIMLDEVSEWILLYRKEFVET